MKKSEEGGVACGICRVSLQQASFAFGVADIVQALLGLAIVVSMMIKKETDKYLEVTPGSQDKISGYTKFVNERCPYWLLYLLMGLFIFQATLGVFLCLGASLRNGVLCMLWILGSMATPMTICLAGIGRLFQWGTVAEFVWKLMNENERKYFTILDVGTELDQQLAKN